VREERCTAAAPGKFLIVSNGKARIALDCSRFFHAKPQRQRKVAKELCAFAFNFAPLREISF